MKAFYNPNSGISKHMGMWKIPTKMQDDTYGTKYNNLRAFSNSCTNIAIPYKNMPIFNIGLLTLMKVLLCFLHSGTCFSGCY